MFSETAVAATAVYLIYLCEHSIFISANVNEVLCMSDHEMFQQRLTTINIGRTLTV